MEKGRRRTEESQEERETKMTRWICPFGHELELISGEGPNRLWHCPIDHFARYDRELVLIAQEMYPNWTDPEDIITAEECLVPKSLLFACQYLIRFGGAATSLSQQTLAQLKIHLVDDKSSERRKRRISPDPDQAYWQSRTNKDLAEALLWQQIPKFETERGRKSYFVIRDEIIQRLRTQPDERK